MASVPGAGGPGSVVLTASADAPCSLEEIGTESLPPGWTVTYSVNGGPPNTELPIGIVGANQTVTVTIINDATAVLGTEATAPGPRSAFTA